MDDQSLPAPLKLPASLDVKAAAPLAQEFIARRGQDLWIDASEVQRVGAQCLQVLLAARRRWDADGHALRFDAPSEPFTWAVTLLGAATLLEQAEDVL